MRVVLRIRFVWCAHKTLENLRHQDAVHESWVSCWCDMSLHHCKGSCCISQWILLREMREIHTAVFLKFLLCSVTGTPHCHVGLIMQRNMTQSWVRSRLYKTCNVLNILLIQYSNVSCFWANIIMVQFLGGEGGACSLNGIEYRYIQGRKIPVHPYSSGIKDSSCQGSYTERFMKFSQSQDDTFHLFMLHISLIISASTLRLYSICPQNKSL